MPRELHYTEPKVINSVIQNGVSTHRKVIEVATSNPRKLEEFRRILTDYEIIGRDLDVDEIQSLDPYKVVSAKAKLAWQKNNFNPILVEDTSLEMMGLGGRPGTYINDFNSIELRRLICEVWLRDKDRRALARVLLAIFDGQEVHIHEGRVSGTIASSPRGTNGFTWDDIFIPDGQKTTKKRTFAEMSDTEKDELSMRRLALEKLRDAPFPVAYPIFMIPEPYEQEIARVDVKALQDRQAQRFAFNLEFCDTSPNKKYWAADYAPIHSEKNLYYTRFIHKSTSKSLGIILTDVDRNNLKMHPNGHPLLWQMGPERRHLALAQRAEFFLENQNTAVHSILDAIDSHSEFPQRANRHSPAVEEVLGYKGVRTVTNTAALKELGYKKISAHKEVSRTAIAKSGLFAKNGKYARSIFGVGSLPAVSGWRDVLVTAAIAHMPIFTHRNNIHAGNITRQAELIVAAKDTLHELDLSAVALKRAQRNIGAAIGAGNIKAELRNARTLYKTAGVRLFRIYTINGDPRVAETAKAIRQEFGEEIELFVGQVTDKEMSLRLIESDIAVDALIYGHGGGRQCTSAENGMAVTTLEEVYSVVTDQRFNHTSLYVEGGVGHSVGPLLILGIDGILYNQQFTRGTIETGDLFFQHLDGHFCHPYHGSASAPTMIIEAATQSIHKKRVSPSGRVRNVEGKAGYTYFHEKANSMAYYINEFKHHAARTLADLGVSSIAELREFMRQDDHELLRKVTTEAAYVASAYKV